MACYVFGVCVVFDILIGSVQNFIPRFFLLWIHILNRCLRFVEDCVVQNTLRSEESPDFLFCLPGSKKDALLILSLRARDNKAAFTHGHISSNISESHTFLMKAFCNKKKRIKKIVCYLLIR